MKKYVFEAFFKFTKWKSIFFQAFSYLQNEKHIFRAFSRLKHGNHPFELFFSFKKWKNTFFKFTKWKKSKFLKRFWSLISEKARFWSAFKFTKWKNTYVNIGIFAKWSISQHRAHKQREILVGILYCKIKVPSTDTHSGNPYIDFFRKSQKSPIQYRYRRHIWIFPENLKVSSTGHTHRTQQTKSKRMPTGPTHRGKA